MYDIPERQSRTLCEKTVAIVRNFRILNSMDTPAAKIIEVFGGTRAAAAALKIAPSTVQSWKETGLIPAQRQAHVLQTARALRLKIKPADFIPA